jgi:hypothetical protein
MTDLRPQLPAWSLTTHEEIGTSALPPLQAHEHHPGISEASSKVFRVQSRDRASEPRVEHSGILHNAAREFGRGLKMHSDVTDGPAPENGLLPSVSPLDVRSVWMIQRDTQKRFPGQQVVIASGTYESACSPGADFEAVYQRASLLYLLGSMDGPNVLSPWTHNGEPNDAVFKVFATFPMKRIPRGQNFGGLPFDFEELAKQIEKETTA